ncbi:hypothetical protein AVEN_219785-1 [Araneus ventricosus]|uniref:Uncharacterized protein n=1 Tax=Araneus ventricosus TaxID=182803 RepID=A0A4Y2JWV3_ARAVE|nr:hypothetical protein AVEN_219785-1 [Araneus ventricosus]
MAEEIDNVFENDQMYIREPTDMNRCVCKERIVCKKPNIFKTGRHESVCVQVVRSCATEIAASFRNVRGPLFNLLLPNAFENLPVYCGIV